MDTPTDFAAARPGASQRPDSLRKRRSARPEPKRCWPASAGTSKTGETLRNAHETRTRGYKNTHVVLWGTPALKRRMREKSTPRNRRRPCGKLAKPRKPRLRRDLRHFRVVQALSTGDPSLNVRPDRGHGQIPHRHQPILRHTGGGDRQASAFPAPLYDAVRGLIPLGCIPLARKNGRCDATRPRRSPFFIRRYAPKKKGLIYLSPFSTECGADTFRLLLPFGAWFERSQE